MSQRTVFRSLTLLALTVVVLAVYTAVALRNSKPTAGQVQPMVELTPESENLYSEFYVPEFTLTDRYGEPISHEVLDGKYTVVDFFFTSCPLWCPGMTQAMHRVQQATVGTGLRFMSISIDGDVDSPEAIDAYANLYRADQERWHFATGDPEVVATMVRDGLKFDLGDPSDSEDAGRLINHPTRLILLGPDRKVIGLYRYDDSDEVDKLIIDARKLVN